MVTQSSSSAKGGKRMNDKRGNDNNVTIEHCARYTDGAEDFEDRDSWLSLKKTLWKCPGLCGLQASPVPDTSR